jgi:hypothetical protein
VSAADSKDVPLSPDGATRREAILADALRAADRRRRSRVARRLAAVTCVCLLALGTIAIMLRSNDRSTHPAAPRDVASGPTSLPTPAPPRPRPPATAPDVSPRVVVQIIPADRVERKWQVIDDDQLIAALAAAGKPAGVARVNGKAVLVPLQ